VSAIALPELRREEAHKLLAAIWRERANDKIYCWGSKVAGFMRSLFGVGPRTTYGARSAVA